MPREYSRKYPVDQIKWFPPKPKLTPWVYEFTIHNFQRNKILNEFNIHNVRTKLDTSSIRDYYEKIAIKSKEKLNNI